MIKKSQKGVALASSLIIAAFLSLSLISYFGILEYQSFTTKDALLHSRTAFLLESALQEAEAKIMDGSELPWTRSGNTSIASAHMSASPGLMSIREFGNTEEKIIPLFSSNASSKELFNINTPNNPFHPDENYLTGYPEESKASNFDLCVHWIPIYEGNSNLVGRYAYWVDVENTKINLNASDRPFLDGTDNQNHLDPTLESLQWWLDWQSQNLRPRIADNSIIYWQPVFENIQDVQTRLAAQQALTNYLQSLSSSSTHPLNSFNELYALTNFQSSFSNWKLYAVIRKALGFSSTLHSRDDERDPLGQPKINIVSFLQQGVNTNSEVYRDLWSRLHESQYHRAYHPGAVARSYSQAFSNWGGDAAVQQVLANVIDYSQPYTGRPQRDFDRGVIGVKAVPYVKEVTTRVRSALWLLSPQDRQISRFIQNINGTNKIVAQELWNEQGTFHKPNVWYLTNVVVEIDFTFQQPRYQSNFTFSGDLLLRLTNWDISHGVEQACASQVSIPVSLPSSTNFFLGAVAGDKITNTNESSILKIQGWDVRATNFGSTNVFHTVPFPHPGQSPYTMRDWWKMAQAGYNVGRLDDANSLYEYQVNNVAVGWVTPSSYATNKIRGFASSNIYIDPDIAIGYHVGNPWTNAATNVQLVRAVQNIILSTSTTNTNNTTIVEHVRSIDPPLGHRTGNFYSDTLYSRRDHFYGALGHSWRHRREDQTNLGREILKTPDGEIIHKETTNCIIDRATNSMTDYQPYVRGEYMTSVGEIGFVHSGFLQTLIPVKNLQGENQNALDYSTNGPPIAMLLDLFTPGAYRDNQTRTLCDKAKWSSTNYFNSPENPRRGTWNVNSFIVGLDEDGKIKSENLSNRGINRWLSFVGGSSQNTSSNTNIVHFNSEADFSFPQSGQTMGTALVANQISTSANTFTIHAVAQTIQNSKVIDEQWARATLEVLQDTDQADIDTQAPFQNRYRVLNYQQRNHFR